MTRLGVSVFWVGILMIASLGLYHTSNRVQEMERELRRTYADIEAVRKSTHVLRADWAYLSNPTRIEMAAITHLGLHPATPLQVTAIDEWTQHLPQKAPVVTVAHSENYQTAKNPSIPPVHVIASLQKKKDREPEEGSRGSTKIAYLTAPDDRNGKNRRSLETDDLAVLIENLEKTQ